jgi:Helicase conserved C-terminal domain
MSSSISSMPKGWRLQDVPNDELAALLKISRKEVSARRAMLLQQQADPAWIAATLDVLPAATLALLHVLIEAGGLVMEDELLRIARERFGMSANDCRVAAGPAMANILMVPLRTRGAEVAFGVVLPAGSLIAPLVAHLDLYELSSAAFVPAESPTRNARTFLAVCVAARHLDVKLTHEGRPHRGSIKRLAKQVGLDEASLEIMLGTGLDLGVLRVESELLRPDIEALANAALGRYPGAPALAALHAQLVGGPVATAALVQALRRRLDWGHQGFLGGGDVWAYLPGFEAGTVDGVPAVTRRAIEGGNEGVVGGVEGVASGHVTPSFEVFLPPEARLVDVVRVGACCEWERLDRVIVARITKPSIARAVTGGASADQIFEYLAAASRHPIPQNVEAAIRDWAGSVIFATVATGHVIVVDPGVHARVGPALAKLDARALGPGVFVVAEREELREVTLALTRAGIYHREVSPARPPSPGKAIPEPSSLPAPSAARIRARVAAWRRGEPFDGVRDDFLEKHRAAQPELPAAPVTGKPAELFERWALQRACRFDDVAPLRDEILSILAMLSDREVASLFEGSRDIDELLHALAKLMVKHGWAKPIARSRRASPALPWQRDGLRERLQRAARSDEVLALQLASGVRYIEITEVMRRGSIWMVLGEDIANDDAVALRLDDIQAIAALPDDFDFGFDDDDDDDLDLDDGDVSFDRKPWRPAHGQAPPPGHVSCPCGSGRRYRHCCRNLATA